MDRTIKNKSEKIIRSDKESYIIKEQNSKNKVIAINTQTIIPVTYSLNIINCIFSELGNMDTTCRKL